MNFSRSKPSFIIGIILVVSAVLMLYAMIMGSLIGRDFVFAFLPSSAMLTLGGIALLIRSLRPPVTLMDNKLFTLLDGIILGIVFFFLGLHIYSILTRGIFGQSYLQFVSLAIFLVIAIVLIKFGFGSPKERPRHPARFTARLLDKLEL